ncbi:MAG: hypothetical protein A3G96_03430 [Gammaproteobacteria bacterium RIFCSPLOWO2_12_FULL_52_10]|nr:MAG: hypothetical protein A3G96_03430 [Gammaproteobacteria bacterium RIFCSPLOWO2_12_FULL_52_10]
MSFRKIFRALILFVALPVSGHAADITGAWTATFDTQIGQQNYTYDFKVDGTTLTGTIKSGNGDATVENGKIEGATVTFTENLNMQGTPLKIDYTGNIVSDDEISFSRKVGEVATEQLVAKRVK